MLPQFQYHPLATIYPCDTTPKKRVWFNLTIKEILAWHIADSEEPDHTTLLDVPLPWSGGGAPARTCHTSTSSDKSSYTTYTPHCTPKTTSSHHPWSTPCWTRCTAHSNFKKLLSVPPRVSTPGEPPDTIAEKLTRQTKCHTITSFPAASI